MPILYLFLMILFGCLNAGIATSKGFKAVRWFFSLGVIGLIAVLCLPSAQKAKDAAESEKREAMGNFVGLMLCWVNVVILALQLVRLFQFFFR